MSTESLALESGADSRQEIATPSTLDAELSLLSSMPKSAADHFVQRLENFVHHPLSELPLIEGAIVTGAAMVLSSRIPAVGMIFSAPRFAAGVAGLDILARTASPMYECWQDPSKLEQAKSDAGRLLGDGLFEDVLAGGAGMVGGRLALSTERLSPLIGEWAQNKRLLAPLNSWAEANQAHAHLRTQLPEFNKAADDLVHFRETGHTKERLSEFMMSFGDTRPSGTELGDHLSRSFTNLYAGRRAMAPLTIVPRTSLGLDVHEVALGGHLPDEGDIGIRSSLLTGGSARSITMVATHEATHLRQTELELRLLADKLGIGSHPSAQDGQSLTDAFRNALEHKHDINPEVLQNVLSVRNGQSLSRSQTAHAQKLLDSEKTPLTKLNYYFNIKEREAFTTGNLASWTRTLRSPMASLLYGDLDSLHWLKDLNEPADSSPKPQ